MSGLDGVLVGFVVARAAYRDHSRLDRLAAENERLRGELAEKNARIWRLEDAEQHWSPGARNGGEPT